MMTKRDIDRIAKVLWLVIEAEDPRYWHLWNYNSPRRLEYRRYARAVMKEVETMAREKMP